MGTYAPYMKDMLTCNSHNTSEILAPTSHAKFAPKSVTNHLFYNHIIIQLNGGQPINKLPTGRVLCTICTNPNFMNRGLQPRRAAHGSRC